jgi:hypothetical protein
LSTYRYLRNNNRRAVRHDESALPLTCAYAST